MPSPEQTRRGGTIPTLLAVPTLQSFQQRSFILALFCGVGALPTLGDEQQPNRGIPVGQTMLSQGCICLCLLCVCHRPGMCVAFFPNGFQAGQVKGLESAGCNCPTSWSAAVPAVCQGNCYCKQHTRCLVFEYFVCLNNIVVPHKRMGTATFAVKLKGCTLGLRSRVG